MSLYPHHTEDTMSTTSTPAPLSPTIQIIEPRLHIFTIDAALRPEVCRAQIARTEAIGFAAAPITTAAGPRMVPDVRDNTRVMIDDVDTAARLWSCIEEYVPEQIELGSTQRGRERWRCIGLNERLRYYRYEGGQKFDWHFDGSFVRSEDERSVLTVLFYLNGDFEGGETRFLLVDGGESSPRVEEVEPRAGRVLVFQHRVRHQGAPVTAGVKYVMRTDVMAQRVE